LSVVKLPEVPPGLAFAPEVFAHFAAQQFEASLRQTWKVLWQTPESQAGSEIVFGMFLRLLLPNVPSSWEKDGAKGCVIVSNLPDIPDPSRLSHTFFMTPQGQLMAEVIHEAGKSMKKFLLNPNSTKRQRSSRLPSIHDRQGENNDGVCYDQRPGAVYYYPPVGNNAVVQVTQIRVCYSDSGNARNEYNDGLRDVIAIQPEILEETRMLPRRSLAATAVDVPTSASVSANPLRRALSWLRERGRQS
jgi:hypothetical protein